MTNEFNQEDIDLENERQKQRKAVSPQTASEMISKLFGTPRQEAGQEIQGAEDPTYSMHPKVNKLQGAKDFADQIKKEVATPTAGIGELLKLIGMGQKPNTESLDNASANAQAGIDSITENPIDSIHAPISVEAQQKAAAAKLKALQGNF